MTDTSLPPVAHSSSAGEFPSRVRSSADVVPGHGYLTDESLGWLAFMDRKATFNETWFKEEIPHASWDNISNPPISPYHRYDLTYACYALAIMAENTPAWREQYGKILGYMADRFLEYHSMWDWVENSGPDPARADYPAETSFLFPEGYMGKYDLPGWAGNGIEPYQYDPDPVRGNGACNLMYKGYLNLVLGFFNYITGDDKYDADFKVRFDADTSYTYSHGSLNELISNQLRANISGLGCEVMKVYPWCLNLTGMAQNLYDTMHGTNHVSSYNGWKRYFRHNMVGNGAGTGPIDWVTLYWDPTIEANMNKSEHQVAYNWFAIAVHLAGLDPELGRRIYESGREKFIQFQPDGTAFSIGLPGLEGDYQMATITATTAAKVFGDDETFEALNSHVLNNYEPTWDPNTGEFYFGFGLGEDWPRGQLNDWMMPAYAITKPGQWQDIFAKPNTAKFDLPTLVGVDFPTLMVRQADSTVDTFSGAFTTVNKDRLGEPTSYTITNLTPGARYEVRRSNAETQEIVASATGELALDAKIATHTVKVRRVA
ncbi:MAG: linalool dehydratase/isomerase domain-containing protein [Sporichthyaceae bacterium]